MTKKETQTKQHDTKEDTTRPHGHAHTDTARRWRHLAATEETTEATPHTRGRPTFDVQSFFSLFFDLIVFFFSVCVFVAHF